jgi:hypothetical protein
MKTIDPKDSDSSSAILNDTGNSNLQKNDNAIADTVSSTGTVLATNAQSDNSVLNPVAAKKEIAKQNATISKPDALKTGDPKDSNSPSTVLKATGKSNPEKNGKTMVDTVSSTGTILAKNTQPDNKTPNPITGKTEVTKQNTIASTPDAIKAIDAEVTNSPSTVSKDAGNSNLQKNDKAVADTVSSTSIVLAKNTQPGNNFAGANAGKVETVKQNTTVSVSDGAKEKNNAKELTYFCCSRFSDRCGWNC